MIGILTVSHMRPEIDEAYCLMIDRIMNDYPNQFLPIATVSIEDEMATFQNHNIETYLYKNNPVGEKHNFTLEKFRGRVTHIIHLGSDDLIDNRYIDEFLRFLDYDIVWSIGAYFFSVDRKEVRFWDACFSTLPASGKLISTRLLDKCNWHIWDDFADNHLDNGAFKILKPHITSQKTFKIRDINALMIDLKSDVNMNLYKSFANVGIPIDAEYIYGKLSKIESDYIKSL